MSWVDIIINFTLLAFLVLPEHRNRILRCESVLFQPNFDMRALDFFSKILVGSAAAKLAVYNKVPFSWSLRRQCALVQFLFHNDLFETVFSSVFVFVHAQYTYIISKLQCILRNMHVRVMASCYCGDMLVACVECFVLQMQNI